MEQAKARCVSYCKSSVVYQRAASNTLQSSLNLWGQKQMSQWARAAAV
jgi:hypothetical protein